MKTTLTFFAIMLFAMQYGNAQPLSKKRIQEGGIDRLVKLPNGGLTILAANNRLFSLDSADNLLWSKEIPLLPNKTEFSGRAIVRLDDGSYVIAGSSFTEIGQQSIALVKTNALGNVIWSKQISDNTYAGAVFIIKTDDGGFAITGGTNQSLSGVKAKEDAYVMKLDGNANFEWVSIIGAQTVENNISEYGTSLVQTKDGGLCRYRCKLS